MKGSQPINKEYCGRSTSENPYIMKMKVVGMPITNNVLGMGTNIDKTTSQNSSHETTKKKDHR